MSFLRRRSSRVTAESSIDVVPLAVLQIASLQTNVSMVDHKSVRSLDALRQDLVAAGFLMERLALAISEERAAGIAKVARRTEVASKQALVKACSASEQHDLAARKAAERAADVAGATCRAALATRVKAEG